MAEHPVEPLRLPPNRFAPIPQIDSRSRNGGRYTQGEKP